MTGIDAYAATLFTFGSDYAYRQMDCDIRLNWRGLSGVGREKAIGILIGFASR